MKQHITPPQARPFSLALYLLIVSGLSWPFMIASAVWGGDNLLVVYTLNCTAMLMVTVGTFIAGRYVFRDGFAHAGWRWGKPQNYLFVIGLALLIWIVPTLLDLLTGSLHVSHSLTTYQVVWVFVLIFVTLIPGFGEEFGWRGYMLPHLAQRMTPRRAVLLHAVIWWAWHLPITIKAGIVTGNALAKQGGMSATTAMLVGLGSILLIGVIGGTLLGVVFAYVWLRGQSLAVSSTFHALYDGFRDSLSVTIGLGPLGSLLSSLLVIVLGILFLWRGDWHNLKRPDAPLEPASPQAESVGV